MAAVSAWVVPLGFRPSSTLVENISSNNLCGNHTDYRLQAWTEHRCSRQLSVLAGVHATSLITHLICQEGRCGPLRVLLLIGTLLGESIKLCCVLRAIFSLGRLNSVRPVAVKGAAALANPQQRKAQSSGRVALRPLARVRVVLGPVALVQCRDLSDERVGRVAVRQQRA